MTINKFQGKTEEEAKEKARQEMGADVVIHECAHDQKQRLFRTV